MDGRAGRDRGATAWIIIFPCSPFSGLCMGGVLLWLSGGRGTKMWVSVKRGSVFESERSRYVWGEV